MAQPGLTCPVRAKRVLRGHADFHFLKLFLYTVILYNELMTYHFSVIITQDKNGMYVAHVPSLRGCHTQAKTLPVLHKRLQEVMALCVEVEQTKRQPILQQRFVAVEQMEVKI